MALARVITFTLDGVEARRVWVEADIRSGLPAFSIVGLADKAVREARERVRAAVTNAGYVFPGERITVNLAPAYLRKVGAAFDLPVAVALLAASGQLPARSGRGRRDRRRALALRRGPPDARRARDGRGRPPRRDRPAAASRSGRGRRGRARPGGRGARRRDAAGGGRGARGQPRAGGRSRTAPPEDDHGPDEPDLADVRGHNALVPALEVAAAGGHNLFLHGPPGTGKTMLARRLPSLLPPMTPAEAIEVTRLASIAGQHEGGLVDRRPFRAPHHTISASGLVGGGTPPTAGRGDARPPRRPLPRRALRVHPPGARGAAPAAGGRPRDDRARPARDGLPDAHHARRRLQPVRLRHGGGGLPLLRGRPRPPPPAAQRARCSTGSTSPSRSGARRPTRSAARPPRRSAAVRERDRRRPRAPDRPARRHRPHLQRPDERARAPRPRGGDPRRAGAR